MKGMQWREHIEANPGVLVGKPVIKGTRISVELVLELLGSGWPQDRILAEYPHIRIEQIQAACLYAAELTRDEQMFATPGA